MLKAKRWVEISVEAGAEAVDDLVNLFGRHCAGGAIVEDKPTDPAQSIPKRVTVKGFLPVRAVETRRKLEIALLLLGKVSPISAPRITTLEPEDWAEAWKSFFPPQHIGRRTVILPTWHTYTPCPDEIIVHIDPGMAFGTGLHASTRLCLVAIEQRLCPGMRVLDVGTGSGILAIAVALQGAATVQALDIDAIAVDVAQENVALNRVERVVTVARGTLDFGAPTDAPLHAETGYDLVLVNILAEVIVEMAPAIFLALRPGGLFVGSGIISERAERVVAALREAGGVVDERMQEDDWVAIIGHRP